MSSAPIIKQLCVIGVGLIGGSFARALRQANAVEKIVGYGRDPKHLEQAQQLGVIDAFYTDIGAAVEHCDVIMVATPLGAMQTIFESLKPHLQSNMILTDVGSAKQSVVDASVTVFGELLPNFVPGHPIAGTERGGVAASFAELFQQRRVILTPHEKTNNSALETVRQLWQACGAQVIDMQALHHDDVLAATSHLPHMLAYTLVDTLARLDDKQEIFDYAAGGFRDFTRIASSDPTMWHDICAANREQLVKILRVFHQDLQRLTEAVEQGDSDFLKQTFTRAKQARDQFCG